MESKKKKEKETLQSPSRSAILRNMTVIQDKLLPHLKV